MPNLLTQQRPAHLRGRQAGLPHVGGKAVWRRRSLRYALPGAGSARERRTGAPGRAQQEAQPGDGV